MAEKVLLKDQLFNEKTVGQLAAEYASALPKFDADRFCAEALAGFPERELMARIEWMADCLERQLPQNFNAMADDLEAAMPAALDARKTDDDFGHFIHAIPGILAARHGLEDHRDRALRLLYNATQRFSMEFYIRPFLNRWPDETLNALHDWANDENYHVRRLVSEGTRPKLPWAKAVSLKPEDTFPLLEKLHADPTRYVTRSVANHMNDLSKTHSDAVVDRLGDWKSQARQNPKELEWMTRHALRTLVKTGHSDALNALGYAADVPLDVSLDIETSDVRIGDDLVFSCTISADVPVRVLVDYRISFARPNGRDGQKVFKLKQGQTGPKHPFTARKTHRLKADATTFTWHPGPHTVTLQVNGFDQATETFNVI